MSHSSRIRTLNRAALGLGYVVWGVRETRKAGY